MSDPFLYLFSYISYISWANLLFRCFQVIPHLFHIFPNLAFLVRVAKQIRRMKSRHYLDAEIILKMASHFCDAVLCIQQIVKRRVAHHNDHLWPDDRDLAQQKWPAGMRLRQRRRTVARRTAAIDIADKNVLAFETDALDDLCQQLARATDKRKSLIVLVRYPGPRRQTSGRPANFRSSARSALRPVYSSQRVQSPMSFRMSSIVSPVCGSAGPYRTRTHPRGPIFLRPLPLSPNRCLGRVRIMPLVYLFTNFPFALTGTRFEVTARRPASKAVSHSSLPARFAGDRHLRRLIEELSHSLADHPQLLQFEARCGSPSASAAGVTCTSNSSTPSSRIISKTLRECLRSHWKLR